MKIIIGLGNPGTKYNNTRHNAGFIALDILADKHDLRWENKIKFNAICAFGAGFVLVKPQVYMNNSGEVAQKILSFYKIIDASFKADDDLSDSLTILHDDIDIDLGKYKITDNSRSAGHNGIKSIFEYLKTSKIKRLRLGVRTENLKLMDVSDFVLQRFSQEEFEKLKVVINEAVSDV